MKIKATKVRGEELQPGDLFSMADQEYWDSIINEGTVGEKVYIRTLTPGPNDQKDDEVFKITIEGDSTVDTGGMKVTSRMLELLRSWDTAVCTCEVCGDQTVNFALVKREGDVLDLVRQCCIDYCTSCGAMQKGSNNNSSRDKGDIEKYNAKRIKILGKDEYPIVRINKTEPFPTVWNTVKK